MEMDVIQKIKELAQAKGWTEYRLVKKSGIPASTISNIFHRNTIPSIPTLRVLCDTFGITLSQFFSEGKEVSLSREQAELLEHWANLKPEQREIMLKLIKTME